MASISRDKAGRCSVQFYGSDHKRHTIRLGQLSRKDAEKFRHKFEALLAARMANVSIDNETAAWVKGLGDRMAAKLAAVGLIEGRATVETATLAEFLDGYIDERKGSKKMSWLNLDMARNRIVKFFTADTRLGDVTPGEADQFVDWLRGEGYSPATVSRTIGYAKQFFRAAQRRRLIPESPFIDLKCGSQANAKRKFFVTRESTAKLLDACPDYEWRIIVALARYGGLRTPSETLKLQWPDVLWDQGKMRVTAPKTEHHAGKGERWVPIFPELRPFLEEAWIAGEEEARELMREGQPAYVITRSRDAKVNWRTTLLKIIRRTGLTPWTKPFQNMRATRETELADQFPAHVVSAWIGNSERVAADHYLQVTEDHMQCAAKCAAPSGPKPPPGESHPNPRPEADGTKSPVLCGPMGDEGYAEGEYQYARQDSNLRPSV